MIGAKSLIALGMTLGTVRGTGFQPVNQKDTAKMAVPHLGADGAMPSQMFRCN